MSLWPQLLSSCNDLLQPVQPADPLAKIKKISTKVSGETWFTVGVKSKDTPKVS